MFHPRLCILWASLSVQLSHPYQDPYFDKKTVILIGFYLPFSKGSDQAGEFVGLEFGKLLGNGVNNHLLLRR